MPRCLLAIYRKNNLRVHTPGVVARRLLYDNGALLSIFRVYLHAPVLWRPPRHLAGCTGEGPLPDWTPRNPHTPGAWSGPGADGCATWGKDMQLKQELVQYYRWLRQYGINDSHSGNA